MNEERHGFFDNEMQMLESFIGKEVKVIYTSLGSKELMGIKGILNGVSSYDSVTINNGVYTFLGPNISIICIGYDEDKHIFFNRNIPIERFLNQYPNYANDFLLQINEQEEFLGYSVKKEQSLGR